MRFTKTKAVLAGLALAATAACGGNAGSDGRAVPTSRSKDDAAAASRTAPR